MIVLGGELDRRPSGSIVVDVDVVAVREWY